CDDPGERRCQLAGGAVDRAAHRAVMRCGRDARGRPTGAGERGSRAQAFALARRGALRVIEREERERGEQDHADEERCQPQQADDRGHHTARLGPALNALDIHTSELAGAREQLISQLREHALVIGEVTLTSGALAQSYVDAKRAILRPDGFAALAALVAAQVAEWGGTAVGGMTMGADPVACAALAGGADARAFFVRKDAKAHGLQRRIEGPPLLPEDRCVVVEDVVTTGGST